MDGKGSIDIMSMDSNVLGYFNKFVEEHRKLVDEKINKLQKK